MFDSSLGDVYRFASKNPFRLTLLRNQRYATANSPVLSRQKDENKKVGGLEDRVHDPSRRAVEWGTTPQKKKKKTTTTTTKGESEKVHASKNRKSVKELHALCLRKSAP